MADSAGESAELLSQLKDGDEQALATMFAQGRDRLLRMVAFRLDARLRGRVEAEDVLQEVFLKVHRAAHQLDPERDPGPWLATLTRNACRERWRRKGRRVDRHAKSLDNGSGIQETLPAGGRGPEDETLRSERDRTIADALMKLSGALREVVVLHDYHGLSHEEIATVVGARGATVRKRYSRALAELRQQLKGVIE